MYDLQIWQCLVAAGAVAAALSMGALTATAGECPADKVVADGQGEKAGATKPEGVTDVVLSKIDLANEPVKLQDHALRLRRLAVKPGGVVPWHTHTDRPAILDIESGRIIEHRRTCTVPIVHRTGESVAEVQGRSPWWKNTGKQTVVILSADLFHDTDDAHMM